MARKPFSSLTDEQIIECVEFVLPFVAEVERDMAYLPKCSVCAKRTACAFKVVKMMILETPTMEKLQKKRATLN